MPVLRRYRFFFLATALACLLLTVSIPPAFSDSTASRDRRFGIAEAYKSALSKETGIGWERIILSWDAIQSGGPGDWRADFVFPPELLQRELAAGIQVVGLLQFTPGWARSDPSQGQRSVPKNLALPWDHPDNYWGRFVRRMAEHFRGRIDHWVVWNEPEIRPDDSGAGASWTWAGGPREYYQLLKAAYRNIKAANPGAKVVFGATAYWLDANAGREQFVKRVLDEAAKDPEAASNDYFFDILGFNIYRGPDDLYRVYIEMKELLRGYGLDKPLWLTETNAMPVDPSVPCAEQHAQVGLNVPLEVQADYAIQALALAAAAGWERIEWYQMTDSNTCSEPAIWGLVRDDGSPRPAFRAFKTAVSYFSGFDRVAFRPLERWEERWHPWPRDRGSYYPNWQVYQVVFDRGRERISVLWSGEGYPLRVRIPYVGDSARLVDKVGEARPLSPLGSWLVVDLKPASKRKDSDPPGYFYIGGEPVIVVQTGVPADTPVVEPSLGDPSGSQPDFRIGVSPEALIALPGQEVSFTLRSQGVDGFSGPVELRLLSYSTERDPRPQSTPPDSISLGMPSTVTPGQTGSITVRTTPGVEPGIHFFTIEASSPGISKTFDVVVQVEP